MKWISSTFNKLGRVQKIIASIVLLAILVFCCCPMVAVAVFPSKATPVAQVRATVTEVTSTRLPPSAAPNQPTARPTDEFTPEPPTAAPSATASPKPTQTPRPTATPVPTIVAGIPGLSPVDVTLNLEPHGFKCTGPTKPADVYLWDCSLDKGLVLYTVFVDAKTLTTVDSIQVVASQLSSPTDDLVAPVFGFIATMPYDNAEPKVARTWVETNLPKLGANGKDQTTTFGGVNFHLYGKPMARCFDIGNLEPDATQPAATAQPSATLKPAAAAAKQATAVPTQPPAVPAEAATIPPTSAVQPTNPPEPTQAPAPTDLPAPTQATEPTHPPASTGPTVINLTSPVARGSNANLSIQTTPGANCFLGYVTPKGNDSTAQGLGSTVADGNGVCSWSWKISSSTTPGTGTLNVTADGKSMSLQIVIQ